MEHNFKWQNNGKIKLCVGLGTRPEIIRLLCSGRILS